jgi:hypothetical protein
MTETGPSSHAPSLPSKTGTGLIALGLIVLVGVGLALRLYQLDKPLMWCDEAESSINAFTILQNGVPGDTYLGLPIYENTLTEPWPESAEYEFKDSSYSSKRLAIYHGWLPLYSIAGSLKWFGIEPDTDVAALKPKHDVSAISRRTMAARVPSVIAGVIFIVVLFFAAREMHSADAGWAAATVAAIAVPLVNISRQARYYSMTATLSAACCFAGWRLFKYGYWRDFIFAGVVFSLLFHTHILTFAIACVACATLLPFMFRHDKAILKMLTCAGIILVATVPWIIATGFLDSAQSVPKAISTMKLPQDLLAWPMKRLPVTLLLLTGMLLNVMIHLRPRWFPARMREAFSGHRSAFYFLGIWVLIAFTIFMTLIPAASLFFTRLYLGAVGPGIIFGAMLFVALGRSMNARVGRPLAAAVFILFVILQTFTLYTWNRERGQRQRMATFIEDFTDEKFRPGTRFYATPNDHLTLQYYTGMPIQSIAPVRRSFLDNYPGDIVMVNCRLPVWPLDWEEVEEGAREAGVDLEGQEVREWAEWFNRVGVARAIAGRAQSVSPPVDPLPEWGESLLVKQLETTAVNRARLKYELMNPSMFRGFTHYRDEGQMWEVFFYRFADPDKRVADPNYRNRLLRGYARILPTLWTIYHSPGSEANATASSHQASIEEKR